MPLLLALEDERGATSHCFLDACCARVSGLVRDFQTYAYGWGFDPREVGAEVHLWHGGRDPFVPVEHALQLAAALPNCRVFIDPDEGHHFFRAGLEQILATLVAAGPAGPAACQSVSEARPAPAEVPFLSAAG